ncbi:hypothetical protein BHM03_00042623 [Ensete ventricosum]|nr:hypothetical protein BHM03_00042623 [Ensete ventricosum]
MVINFREAVCRVEFRLVFCAPSQKFKILVRRVKFRSVFRALSRKFKILAIPDVLAHGKSYKHGHKLCTKSRVESSFDRFFMHHLGNSKHWPFPTSHGKLCEHGYAKKRDGHKLCTKSRAESIHGKSYEHKLCMKSHIVEFRSVFHAPSQKFKILAIPDVLAHWKSYEYGFVKKLDGHKLCPKSRADLSFDRCSCTVSEI